MLPVLLLAMSCITPTFTGVSVDVIHDNIDTPWDVIFTEHGTGYMTSREGILYHMYNDTIRQILQVSVGGGEGGLLGVTIHPNYTSNNMVYLYHTDIHNGNTVSRYIHNDTGIHLDKVIISDMPSSLYHNGGRIQFGPDSMLYVTTGDAGNSALSQDIDSLAGKILRLDADGNIPHDNPFPDSFVYAYGLRNPQGITWTYNGTMIVTDHGPSGILSRAHDEINIIVPGGDYGWPDYIGSESGPAMHPPLIHSGSETWAPSGLVFVSNSAIPAWEGMLVYGALRGEHLGLVSEDGTHHDILFEGDFGRIRAPVLHPNGTIYVITSNTDGRGDPSPNDDVLLRVSSDPAILPEYQSSAASLWDLCRNHLIDTEQLQTGLKYLSER